jgi:hypothetical protein
MPLRIHGQALLPQKHALELDGRPAGWLNTVDNSLPAGAIQLTCGAGMSNACYQWIRASFDHLYLRKSGAIIAADYNNREIGRLEFANALITEIGMPALDAASKDAAKMTIVIAQGHGAGGFDPKGTPIAVLPPSLQPNSAPAGGSSDGVGIGTTLHEGPAKQKQWMPSNFRLKIDGLEQDCMRVNKIEPITIHLHVGDTPSLGIHLPPAHADGFYKWYENAVLRGQGTPKSGSLEYLAGDLSQALFTLTFAQLGIFKLTPDKMEAGSESIRRVKVEMYCERVHFGFQRTWS